MEVSTYRGFRIETQMRSDWAAIAYPPGATLALPDFGVATREEGKAICLQRIHEIIDECIAANSAIFLPPDRASPARED